MVDHMDTPSPSFPQKLIPDAKRLFLIDGLGAVLSAFSLGFVLVQLEAYIGMPRDVLYGLAAVAGVFAMYSLSCHFRFPTHWQPYLRGISIANLLYCMVTLGLVIYYFPRLTVWGVLYFVFEMLIVLTLVRIEWRRSAKVG